MRYSELCSLANIYQKSNDISTKIKVIKEIWDCCGEEGLELLADKVRSNKEFLIQEANILQYDNNIRGQKGYWTKGKSGWIR